MKKLLYASILLAVGLAGCRHDSDPTLRGYPGGHLAAHQPAMLLQPRPAQK
ncbi:MAG: hypothetical protein WKG07_46755 [Hymenobacter sp.]